MRSDLRRRFAGYYFFYYAFLGAFTPYFSLYLKALAFPAAQIGILMSLAQGMRMVAPWLWGWLADATGRRRRLIAAAAAATVISFSGVFFGHSFVWLLAVLAAMCFFWTAALPLVEASALDQLAGDSGRYARLRLWGSLGFIIAVLAIGALLDRAPVTVLPWIVLALGGGLWLFACCLPETTPAAAAARGGAAPAWRQPHVLAFLIACGLMSLAHGAYYSFYSLLLVSHGHSGFVVGAMWTLGVVSEILVFIGFRALRRRFSAQRLLLACCALAALRFVLIGQCAGSMLVLTLAQLLHAASFAAFHGAAMAVVHHCFPGRAAARGQALYGGLAYGAGGALGAVLAGWAWQALGPAATFTAAGLAATLSLLLLLRYGAGLAAAG